MTSSRLVTLMLTLTVIGLVATSSVWLLGMRYDNTLPIEQLMAGVDAHPAHSAVPKLMFLGGDSIENSHSQSYRRLRLVLMNPTPFRIEYVGYTPDSYSERPPMGQIHPWYALQKFVGGEWVPQEIGWCGFGQGRLSVRSGHAGQFEVYHEFDDSPVRIGLAYKYVNEDGILQDNMIWSEELRSTESGVAEAMRWTSNAKEKEIE